MSNKSNIGKRIVGIFNTTLRDGQQAVGCNMNLPEKIEIAKRLEKLDIMEAGFPTSKPGDLGSVENRGHCQKQYGSVSLPL